MPDKKLCSYLIATYYNYNVEGDRKVLKSESKRFQDCMEDKCMAYDKTGKHCRRTME